MSTPSDPQYQVPQTDGKAIGSLVCGILGLLCILPVIGQIVAIVLGHMSLSEIRASGGRKGGSGLAISGLVTGYLGFVTLLFSLLLIPILAGMTLPVLSKAREKARRVNCAANLKQLGLACLMYSGENDGAFPPDLASLAETDVLHAGRVYVCPSSGDVQTPLTAGDLRGGMSGYDYFGQGARDDMAEPFQTIIAADKPSNHSNGQWMNFLFADGHVEGRSVASVEEACLQENWRLPSTEEP